MGIVLEFLAPSLLHPTLPLSGIQLTGAFAAYLKAYFDELAGCESMHMFVMSFHSIIAHTHFGR